MDNFEVIHLKATASFYKEELAKAERFLKSGYKMTCTEKRQFESFVMYNARQFDKEKKQFLFQEDTWNIIKEFVITPRSILLLKIKRLGITRLCEISKAHFCIIFVNIKNSKIPLEKRRNILMTVLINHCDAEPAKYAAIMDQFPVKPNKVKK